MKRNDIIKSLLNEGFSEKTLLNFNDKQLNDLAVRIFSEETINIPKDDIQSIEAAKKEKKPFVTYEQEVGEELKGDQTKIDKNKNGKIDSEDFKLLKKNKEKKNIKEWVSNVANKNFHSFTSKNEIMEMIQIKLQEQEVGSKVKKGHNGIPEFMSYDVISNTETVDAEPTTKPAPTKPKTNPGIKPKTPYQPGPGKNPKPKALKEDK
jgi:glutamyl/glutaminyl-tRNA synthetase